MKKAFAIIVIAFIGVCVWVAFGDEIRGTFKSGYSATMKAYNSPTLGISFQYPIGYSLEEKNLSSGQRRRYEVVLTKDKDPLAQEGPTAITIGAFQNDLDGQSAEEFVTGTNDSNYKLGDGSLSRSVVAGREGVTYHWSGLYEGQSTVVATDPYIYMMSVTFMSPDDQIIKDFDQILGTLRFLVQ